MTYVPPKIPTTGPWHLIIPGADRFPCGRDRGHLPIRPTGTYDAEHVTCAKCRAHIEENESMTAPTIPARAALAESLARKDGAS